MVFGKGRVTSDIAVTINQNIIERIYETTFLGMIIDDKLSWKAHIQSVKSNLAKTLSIIYKATLFLKASALNTLYFSLFLPYIDYCSEIWGNTYRRNLMPLLFRDMGKYLSQESNAPSVQRYGEMLIAGI